MRGSIPAPGAADAALRRQHAAAWRCACGDELLIFDLGTGVRPLGEALLAEAREPVEASIFLSHYHYDHLQGLPFFTPIFNPQNAFTLYGPSRNGQSVKEILAGQMVQPYFPVTADEVFRAQLSYRASSAGETACSSAAATVTARWS